MSALFISALSVLSVTTGVSVSGEHDFASLSITHWETSRKFGVSHCSLFAEPLLASSAILDVLQHITQHCPLPTFVLAHPLYPLIHLGTWEEWHGGVKDSKEACISNLGLQFFHVLSANIFLASLFYLWFFFFLRTLQIFFSYLFQFTSCDHEKDELLSFEKHFQPVTTQNSQTTVNFLAVNKVIVQCPT